MRINHNISAQNTYRQYTSNTSAASKSMEKLSSGLRINRAADDAAGLSISEKMRASISSISQQLRNSQDNISQIQTAEGALNEVSDMLVRMKELVIQKGNTTYGNDEKDNIDSELKALNTSLNKILDDTDFNGTKILDDTAMTAQGMTLTRVAEATLIKDDAAADLTAAEAAVDATIKSVNTVRAGFGAKQNALEHDINNMSTTNENLTAAESRIRDVDMAEEMMQYTKNNILIQAAQSMLAQANSQPQGILQLLQ